MTGNIKFDKFSSRPTAKIRLAATTFLVEKEIFKDVDLRHRASSRDLADELTRLNFEYLKKANNTSNYEESFDYRTWNTWRNGKLKNNPNHLQSICEKINPSKKLGKLLEIEGKSDSLQLYLSALDVFAFHADKTHSPAMCRWKIQEAMKILSQLEKVWGGNKYFGQLKIKDSWLNELDKTAPLKQQNRITSATDLTYFCSETKTHYYEINSDVISGFEEDAPLLLLQYMFKNILYLHNGKPFPIHTYAIDLATACIAASIIYFWREDLADNSNFNGSKLESLDATRYIFFHYKIDQPRYLISIRAPWDREKYDDTNIIQNILILKKAYRKTLHEIGVTSRETRKIYEIKF